MCKFLGIRMILKMLKHSLKFFWNRNKLLNSNSLFFGKLLIKMKNNFYVRAFRVFRVRVGFQISTLGSCRVVNFRPVPVRRAPASGLVVSKISPTVRDSGIKTPVLAGNLVCLWSLFLILLSWILTWLEMHFWSLLARTAAKKLSSVSVSR